MTDSVEAIASLAMRSASPHIAKPGTYNVWRDFTDGALIELDLSGLRPARKTGTATVRDIASFAEYFGRHADDDTEVYADLDHLTITAVLDAHTSQDGARWQEHRLVLALQVTPEWAAWIGNDGKMLAQVDFAEFLEDHHKDVHADDAFPVSGADLLEIAQQFQATTKVTFESGTRLKTGETQLHYQETIAAKAGQRGDLVIPSLFQLGIAPFEDSGHRKRITARFRYRIEQSGLKLGYRLDTPERFVRDEVTEIVAKVSEETGRAIMHGRPAAA